MVADDLKLWLTYYTNPTLVTDHNILLQAMKKLPADNLAYLINIASTLLLQQKLKE